MTLASVGHLIGNRRRALGMTLAQLASAARVGRSTLAALETGKLSELGFVKLTRLCAVVGLVLEARPMALDAPLMTHRHLTTEAGCDLTKAAIADVIAGGDIAAWRGLVRVIRAQAESPLSRRVRQVVQAMDKMDPKVQAFAELLPEILRQREPERAHG
jgi:transcriptional regulator with XRE-family HTH domain